VPDESWRSEWALPGVSYAVGHLDHGAMLMASAVALHHGSSGMVHQCLRLACPQVLLPLHFDQVRLIGEKR
jgi:UDP:flavonoid glycosyltransferase YjiC (YdhE family)